MPGSENSTAAWQQANFYMSNFYYLVWQSPK